MGGRMGLVVGASPEWTRFGTPLASAASERPAGRSSVRSRRAEVKCSSKSGPSDDRSVCQLCLKLNEPFVKDCIGKPPRHEDLMRAKSIRQHIIGAEING